MGTSIINNTIYNECCLDTMKRMKKGSIDMVLTSPPYESLRTYEHTNNSWNFNLFKKIVKALKRIVKPGGVIVWVVGDQVIEGSESGMSFKQALYFKKIGFNLHDTMIYQKANFSNPSSNRYHQIFEYMFVFTKGKPKTFNPIIDKVNKCAGQTCLGNNTVRQKNGDFRPRKKKIYQKLGMRTNIWRMNTAGQENPCKSQKHPAPFPLKLALDQIQSWSNKGEIVYDPMMGGGTTAVAAMRLGRNYLGSEIVMEYCNIADNRINNH